jgi:hypothetical protein
MAAALIVAAFAFFVDVHVHRNLNAARERVATGSSHFIWTGTSLSSRMSIYLL